MTQPVPKYSYVYCLTEAKKPRYVGQSVQPHKRLCQHIAETRQRYSHSALTVWLRDLIAREIQPGLVVLGRFPISQVTEREEYFIRQFRANGYALLNRRKPVLSAHVKIAYERNTNDE